MSPSASDLPIDALAMRLTLFELPEDELRDVLHGPWPDWMKRLYALEARQRGLTPPDHADVESRVTVSMAVSALKERLAHRLDVLSWVASELELMGWHLEVDDQHLIASKSITPALAHEELEARGVAGPLAAVCDLDEEGWPRLYAPWELKRENG